MLWVLKEPSQWDGYFKHLKHMFKLMDKKIIPILRFFFCITGPMPKYRFSHHKAHMGLEARKPVFGGLQTTKAYAQSDQRLCCSLNGKNNV